MKQTEVSKIVKQQEPKKNRREGRGRVLALSRQIYRLLNKNTFYVESESSDNRYYFVRYNPSVFEWCSCKDFESNRAERCKHLYGVEYAIRFATVKEVDKLPEEVTTKPRQQQLSYERDQYDF